VGDVTNFWHPCVTTAMAHGVQVAKSIQFEHMAEVPGRLRSMAGAAASGCLRTLVPAAG
jgi:hypothetical protein